MTEMTKAVYIFPGQGSQWVGMGRDLYQDFPAAKAVFDLADEVLKFPLSRLCFEGPEDELRQTVNAQPALVTASLACYQAIRESGGSLPSPAFIAGHSLGEYTALAVAEVLDAATTIYLARERGRLMYEAGLLRPGGMAAIIGLDEAPLAEVCKQSSTWMANINCPGQIVISGAREDIAHAMALARDKGAHRAIPLQVSGAFHTPLMQPAYDGMTKAIAKIDFHAPIIPIIANSTAQPLTAAKEVKEELLRQLCNCLLWQQSIEYMVDKGVSTFIEIGPGKVLTGLVKRISKEAETINIGDAEAVRGLGNPSP